MSKTPVGSARAYSGASPFIIIALVFSSILLLTGFLVYRFGREVSFIGLFILAVVLGVLSRIPDRFSGKSSGIDVGVFFTACILFAWGIKAAFLAGLLINISAFFVAKERPQDTLSATAILSLVLVLVDALPFLGVFYSGLLLVLLYDLVCVFVYPFIGHTIDGSIRFGITHFVWSYALFSAFGEELVRIMVSVG